MGAAEVISRRLAASELLIIGPRRVAAGQAVKVA
jgi:hypothetical protein